MSEEENEGVNVGSQVESNMVSDLDSDQGLLPESDMDFNDAMPDESDSSEEDASNGNANEESARISELERLLAESEGHKRALQSSYDQKFSEMEQWAKSLESKLNSPNREDDFDSYSDDDYLTGGQVKKIISDLERQKEESARAEQGRREKILNEENQIMNNWVTQRDDYDAVNKYFQSNNLSRDPAFKDLVQPQAHYYFAKFKMEQKNAKDAYNKGLKDGRKGKVPPTGNPGRSSANRSSLVSEVNSFSDVIKKMRKDRMFNK